MSRATDRGGLILGGTQSFVGHGSRSSETTGSSATSERILEVAAELFRARGYAATTTREIAAAVGIRNASLYHYIGQKEDLLLALCLDSLERITSDVTEALESVDGAADPLPTLIQAHLASAIADQHKHVTMLTELRSLSEEHRSRVVAMRIRYERVVTDTIAEAQQSGVLRADIDATVMARALLNMLNWTIFWFRPGPRLEMERFGKILATLFIDGAGAKPDA